MALQTFVRSGQRKARLLVMVEPPPGPAVRVMTLRAVGPKAAGVMLVLVATRARPRRVLEGWRAMTILAGDRCVKANEGKPREVVIERDLVAPAGFVVALVAARSELAFVRIILLVAADARGCQLVAVEIAFVARVALDLGVAAEKREFCRLGMIEVHRLPGLRGMTGLALCAVSPAMRVLQAVACTASSGQVLVALTDMTCGTGDFGMGADQGEPRLGMIERLDAPPVFLAVAALAFLAQPAFVRVRRLVAIEALARGCSEFDRRKMAALAARRLMCSFELEVRESMIECLSIELDNVRATALVIGMACPTISFRCVGPTPVEPASLLAVGRNVLVTIQA